MRIGIDTQAISQRKSGLGIYTSELISHLKTLGEPHEYFLFGNLKGEKTYHRLFWENTSLPLEALKQKVDVLHTPAFAAPIWKGNWRSVVTIHDLIGMIFPTNLSFVSRWYWSKWLPLSNSKCDHIIADSQCTKRDIIKFLKVSEEKITVIHLAASEHFKNNKSDFEINSVCSKYSIKKPYVLYVGNIEPRKNLIRTIKAFSKAIKKNLDHSLVLVGSFAWAYADITQLVAELGLQDRVKCLNYVNDEELITLYNGSELFLFPSLYEGFGIPILEAMACGTPVLTSNVSSLPEIGGDAVFYVDPTRENEIEDGIVSLLKNSQMRESLKQKGFLQVKKFNWEKTAKETLSVYQKLL